MKGVKHKKERKPSFSCLLITHLPPLYPNLIKSGVRNHILISCGAPSELSCDVSKPQNMPLIV